MIAVVFLVIALFALWIVYFIIQFTAMVSLLALSLGLLVTAAVYGFTFLSLYFIFGEADIGWAIFGAMFLGTVMVKKLAQSIFYALDRKKLCTIA